MQEVKVSCPATVANLVCGFDVLGMCLDEPFDIMTVKLLTEKKVVIIADEDYHLPVNPNENSAGAPLVEIINQLDNNTGFEISIKKNIKPGSGIGSSAASAAGAAFAANYLLGNIFTKQEVVSFAMAGEKVASGVKHADNIAPSIYGGITLIRSIFPLDIVPLSYPELYVTLVHPQIEVKTADARQILKKQVLLKDAIKQWGNIAGLVAGFMKEDYGLIGRSLEDGIIEPLRSILIPGFDEVKSGSKMAGALGGGISGSGPSIFMLSTNMHIATEIEKVMEALYKNLGIDFKTYVTKINKTGIKILEA